MDKIISRGADKFSVWKINSIKATGTIDSDHWGKDTASQSMKCAD